MFGHLPKGDGGVERRLKMGRWGADDNARTFLGGASSLAFPNLFSSGAMAADPIKPEPSSMHADLIFHTGLITTLDRANPNASAVAIKDGKFLAVGTTKRSWRLPGPDTKIVDLKGKRVLPGLIDNHTHVIRGGLNFNMELRWDGVRSLADAMDMLKRQVAITPAPQWVRVVGGFTEHQFAEKRLPTIDEINAIAPDTPVFLLHLYDRALAERRCRSRRRLHQGHAEPAGRRDHPRRQRQSDRPAARQAECRHPLFDACQGAEAAARIPGQLHPPFHARTQPPRHHRRDRCRAAASRIIPTTTRSSRSSPTRTR
jgi:hypothetical protein